MKVVFKDTSILMYDQWSANRNLTILSLWGWYMIVAVFYKTKCQIITVAAEFLFVLELMVWVKGRLLHWHNILCEEQPIKTFLLLKKYSGMAAVDSSAPETTSSDNSPTLIRRSWAKHAGPGSVSGSSESSSDSLGSSSSGEQAARKAREHER